MTEADTCRKYVVPKLVAAGWEDEPHSIAEQRTEAIARHLTDFLKKTDRFAKTIVFCVDQEHADEMRRVLNNLNADLVAEHPNYVCRVTADEGDIGCGHMQTFQDVEAPTPVILTTSQLLSTGLDAPTCKNVVIARLVNSMVEFKQIIGRGTRVRDDYDKLWFNILDYTGSATQKFADPTFDGDPAFATVEEIDRYGAAKNKEVITPEPPEADHPGFTETDPPLILEGRATASPTSSTLGIIDPAPPQRRKFYFDQGSVEIAAHLVYELDADGKQLRVLKYTDYIANKVRTLYPSSADLRKEWSDPEKRDDIVAKLAERGIDFDQLALQAGHPESDPLDLLCHLAFNAPLRTRRERADRLKREASDFFAKFGSEARAVLNDLLDKYTEHGATQFQFPEALKIPPISERGSVSEIASHFGGPEKLRSAVNELQTILYAA